MEVVQGVTSVQYLCILGGGGGGGIYDICLGMNDMSRGGSVSLSRGQFFNKSCPRGGYIILSRGCRNE